jgi:hypothetical protein
MWSQALLQKGKPAEAAKIVASGLQDHPKHPDLYYALLMAAGLGYAGSSLEIHRDHGMFGGVAVTLGRAPRVVEGLVHMGVLSPEVLNSPVMNVGAPSAGEQSNEQDVNERPCASGGPSTGADHDDP